MSFVRILGIVAVSATLIAQQPAAKKAKPANVVIEDAYVTPGKGRHALSPGEKDFCDHHKLAQDQCAVSKTGEKWCRTSPKECTHEPAQQ